MYPAGGQRPFTACSVPDPLSSVPLSSSSRPRLARPFGVVYASGIQMTAFARAEECPTISAWLRSRTTRLQAGIRSLISFFSSPPSCGGAGNVLLRPYTTTTTLDTPLSPLPLHPRNPPFRVTDRSYVSTVYQPHFHRTVAHRDPHAFGPAFINRVPSSSIVSMNSIKLFSVEPGSHKMHSDRFSQVPGLILFYRNDS